MVQVSCQTLKLVQASIYTLVEILLKFQRLEFNSYRISEFLDLSDKVV